MRREDLIQKWLDHALNPEELEAFKQLEDYKELTKMQTALQYFKAPEVDVDSAYTAVTTTKKDTLKPTSWLKPLLKIAAILVIGFGTYMYATLPTLTTHDTVAANKVRVDLPDASEVTLNAISSLSYDQDAWEEKREVNLDGEAYFKVKKGSTFTVNTTNGNVKVLGTQFNVNSVSDYFEVICFEGKVRVHSKAEDVILLPANSVRRINGHAIETWKTNTTNPTWIDGESSFKSVPLLYVIAALEAQYNIKIDANTIDQSLIYTGSFTHNDLDTALKTVFRSLQIHYEKEKENIYLSIK